MIVYEVRAVMEASLVDEYRAWLEDHIREILAIPGFRYAELHREDADQPAASETEALLVIRYHLEDRAGLEAYRRFKQLEFGRTEMWKELSPILQRCDALICPTMAQPAPGHGRSDQDFWRMDDQGQYLALDVTSVWNFVSQCPAISIPAGFTKDGLPIGLQVIGRHHDEPGVMNTVAAIESVIGFDRLAG